MTNKKKKLFDKIEELSRSINSQNNQINIHNKKISSAKNEIEEEKKRFLIESIQGISENTLKYVSFYPEKYYHPGGIYTQPSMNNQTNYVFSFKDNGEQNTIKIINQYESYTVLFREGNIHKEKFSDYGSIKSVFGYPEDRTGLKEELIQKANSMVLLQLEIYLAKKPNLSEKNFLFSNNHFFPERIGFKYTKEDADLIDICTDIVIGEPKNEWQQFRKEIYYKIINSSIADKLAGNIEIKTLK